MFPKCGLQITALWCHRKENQNIFCSSRTSSSRHRKQCILEVKNRINFFARKCLKTKLKTTKFSVLIPLIAKATSPWSYSYDHTYKYMYFFTFFSQSNQIVGIWIMLWITISICNCIDRWHDYRPLFSRRRGCDYYFLPIVQ